MVLIDDEDWLLEMVESAIRDKFKNLELKAFQDSKEAWQELAKRDPDILITGANMGELGGEEIVRRLIERKAPYPVLVMSGWSPTENWVKAFANKKPNVSFLQKPFNTEQLHAEISKLLRRDDQPTLNSRQSKAGECKPLIDAATKDLFRKNAFRITGLSVDATTREVSRHADKLKMLAELGQDPHTQSAAFPMKPPPSLDEIREAIQKIKDPEKRLVDEFFWFWPEEFGNSQSDPAMQALAKGDSKTAIEIWASRENGTTSSATAKHNLALVYHVCALDWENYSVKNTVEAERREKMTNYWKGAFSRWEYLATNEQFWEQVVARIRQLNEPSLPTGFARRMRATLPEALDKINAELAVAFAESGKIELARLHIQFMRETHQGLDNVEKTAELVLTPARNHLKEQIQRARESAQQNPATAHEAARTLIEHALPLMDVFDLFFGEQEHFQKELFDEAATTVVNCLVSYQRKSGDNETFVKLLERTLPLAESVEVRRRIEENIGIGKGNLKGKEFDSVYSLLKSIQDSTDSPAVRLARFKRDAVAAIVKAAGISGYSENYGYLSATSAEFKELFDSAAIVLRGISLDAWNKHQDRQTAVAANDLAIKHATSPELKQRLAEDKATLQQMGAQAAAAAAAQREKSNNTGVGCLVVVAIFIVLGVIGSCNSTSNTSSNHSYTPPAPAYSQPSAAPAAPTYTPPSTYGEGNSGGNVYRVPSSVSSTLKIEKEEIESERATLEVLEAQIEKLGREIERDRIYLDRTSQFAVDSFNEKVDRYNALNQKAKIANAAFNEKVDNYNAKLQRYGR